MTSQVNALLHEYARIIEGRMGLPMKQYATNVITVICLGENDEISSLAGKLGRLNGVTAKASYSAKVFE